jgi:integrase/recombinase XerD
MDNQQVLRNYFRECKACGIKPKTLETAKYTLDPFIKWCGDKDLTTFTKYDVYDYLDYLESYRFERAGKQVGYSDGSIYRTKSVLKKFLTFINPELKDVIKLKHSNNEKHPSDILTKEEVELLLNACLTPRDRAMLATFYESGARKGEMLACKVKHLNFDEHGATLDIPKGKTGSRHIRLIFASSFLHTWLDCHPLKPMNEKDPNQKENFREAALFCSLQAPYNIISPSGLRDQLHALADRAGISRKKVFPHALRHARATHLAEHLTEAQMKEFLGWTRGSQMASVYVHLSGRDMDNAVLKMYGVEVEGNHTESLKIGRCPRCHQINSETQKYCGTCGMPLKQEAVTTEEKEEIDFEKLLIQIAQKHPEILSKLDFNKNQD